MQGTQLLSGVLQDLPATKLSQKEGMTLAPSREWRATWPSVCSFLAPAVTVGETEGAMDSTSVLFFTSSFAYNFVRK